MRRDLHDGLGPALTGVMLKAAAARRLRYRGTCQIRRIASGSLSETSPLLSPTFAVWWTSCARPCWTAAAWSEPCRITLTRYRPLSGPRLQFTSDGVADLGQLHEAVEVAAYRAATESLTNVLRHAHADSASISLWIDDNHAADENHRRWHGGCAVGARNRIVVDAGAGSSPGGRMSAGPTEAGGEVRVALPLEGS